MADLVTVADPPPIMWYPAARGRVAGAELIRFAGSQGLILEGRTGVARGTEMRQLGYSGPLLLESVPWKSARESYQTGAITLTGVDEFADAQQSIDVAQLVAPGLVVTDDLRTFRNEIKARVAWLEEQGARLSWHRPTSLSITIDHSLLISSRLPQALRVLRDCGETVMMSFAKPGDPFDSVEAVSGLETVVDLLPYVAIVRTDLAAIAAISLGARFAAVGIGTSTRHVAWESAYAVLDDRSPSVLVAQLWSFKRGSVLRRWADTDEAVAFTCQLSCCGGQELGRLDAEHHTAEAQEHNRQTLNEMVRQIVGSADRRAAFQAMIALATFEYDNVNDVIPERVRLPGQLKAWSERFQHSW